MMHRMSEAEEEEEDEDDEDEEDDTDEEEKASDKKGETETLKYPEFWKEFGQSVKLGCIEDNKNRKKLIQLLRFKSTRSPENPISLKSYVDNMPDKQKNIYYMSAGSLKEAEESPFMERVREKGYEVLYFVDNLDEYLNLADYEDFPLQSVTKEGLDLGEGTSAAEWLTEKEEDFKSFTDWLKNLYGSKVQKVALSMRLEESPMIIATTKHGQSANMLRILSGQTMTTNQ